MIDGGWRAGCCQSHQTAHRGLLPPETPRDVLLAKATVGRVQARISADRGPQMLRGWEPFKDGG